MLVVEKTGDTIFSYCLRQEKIIYAKKLVKIIKLLLLFPGIDVSYIKEHNKSTALSDAKYNLSRERNIYSERYNNFIEIIKLLEEKK